LKRALVVDDDEFMVKTLSDVLRLEGWDVSAAYSGSAAVIAAAREEFDVVLMDVKMPGMDGVDALRAMKAARPEIRVVLMTAYAALDRIDQAERDGVVRVLAKPLDIASLLTVLDDVLRAQHPVLLVDHDATFLKTLSSVLRLRGFEVVQAQDVFHATQLITERRPMAVLLHVAAGSVKDTVVAVHAVNPKVALILYSGRPETAEEVKQSLPRDWVHAYLNKPFPIDKLTGVLDAIRDD
jgi:DNA-binding NtrC family response regulator